MDYNYCMKQFSCNVCKRNLYCGKEKRMRKIIRIGSKDFEMQSSAYTQFKYKDETGRSLVKDLITLADKYKDLANKDFGNSELQDIINQWDDLDEFLMMTLKIAFIMTHEADSNQASNFETFLKQVDGYMDNINWFGEVVELALSPLSGQVQTFIHKQQ